MLTPIKSSVIVYFSLQVQTDKVTGRMGMLKCCDSHYASKCGIRDPEGSSSWCWFLTRPYWGAWTLWFQILNLASSSSHWHTGLYFCLISECVSLLGTLKNRIQMLWWFLWGGGELQVSVQFERSNLYEIEQKGIKFCFEGQLSDLHHLLMCSPEYIFWGSTSVSIKLVKNVLQQWL